MSGLGWQNKPTKTEMLQSSFHNSIQFIRTIQNAGVQGGCSPGAICWFRKADTRRSPLLFIWLSKLIIPIFSDEVNGNLFI